MSESSDTPTTVSVANRYARYALGETDQYNALLDMMTNSDHDGWVDVL